MVSYGLSHTVEVALDKYLHEKSNADGAASFSRRNGQRVSRPRYRNAKSPNNRTSKKLSTNQVKQVAVQWGQYYKLDVRVTVYKFLLLLSHTFITSIQRSIVSLDLT